MFTLSFGWKRADDWTAIGPPPEQPVGCVVLSVSDSHGGNALLRVGRAPRRCNNLDGAWVPRSMKLGGPTNRVECSALALALSPNLPPHGSSVCGPPVISESVSSSCRGHAALFTHRLYETQKSRRSFENGFYGASCAGHHGDTRALLRGLPAPFFEDHFAFSPESPR
jgi:hypothetical protein